MMVDDNETMALAGLEHMMMLRSVSVVVCGSCGFVGCLRSLVSQRRIIIIGTSPLFKSPFLSLLLPPNSKEGWKSRLDGTTEQYY